MASLSLIVPGFCTAMAFGGEGDVNTTFLLIAIVSFVVLCGGVHIISKKMDKEAEHEAAAYEAGFVACQEVAHSRGAVDVKIERRVEEFSGDIPSEHFIDISGTPGAGTPVAGTPGAVP